MTEDDWRAYFQSACGTLRIDLDVVSRSMSTLVMNTKFADAESRVGRLLADFRAKLEEIDMTDLISREPKACVKILVAAVRPMSLKSLIEKELKKEDAGRLKKNVVEFTEWLQVQVEVSLPYERWSGRSDAITEVKEDKPKRDWKANRNGGAKIAAVSLGDTKPKNVQIPAKSNRKKCLKCGDKTHQVFQCSQVVPGEAKKLLDAHFHRTD